MKVMVLLQMIEKRKIIIMSKLALYEKKYSRKDSKINQYFQHDYVYIKNMWTRISAGIGTFIVILLYWLHKIMVEGNDIAAIDYRQELINTGIVFLIVLAVYTVIGTIKESVAFNKSAKRLNKYNNLINQLEIANKRAEKEAREAALLHGADFIYPRRNN